jgi:hypothetical protein
MRFDEISSFKQEEKNPNKNNVHTLNKKKHMWVTGAGDPGFVPDQSIGIL